MTKIKKFDITDSTARPGCRVYNVDKPNNYGVVIRPANEPLTYHVIWDSNDVLPYDINDGPYTAYASVGMIYSELCELDTSD